MISREQYENEFKPALVRAAAIADRIIELSGDPNSRLCYGVPFNTQEVKRTVVRELRIRMESVIEPLPTFWFPSRDPEACRDSAKALLMEFGAIESLEESLSGLTSAILSARPTASSSPEAKVENAIRVIELRAIEKAMLQELDERRLRIGNAHGIDARA